MSDSSARLLSTVGWTRLQKSKKEAKGPFSSRSATMWPTRPSPTLRTADMPNGIEPAFPTKSLSATLTSGTRTGMPSTRHSLR